MHPSLPADTHHDAKDAIRGRDQRVARPSVLRRENLGRKRIERAVHDVVRERVAAVPAEERVGRARGRAREEEHPGDDCVESVAARGQVQVPVSMLGRNGTQKRRRTGGYCEGAFASEVGEFDHPPCEERAGDADNAQDDLLYAQV